MKTLLIALYLSVIPALAWQCTDKNNTEPPYLTISDSDKTVNFKAAPAQKSIAVESNLESWSATVRPAAEEWLIATRRNAQLIISVAENTTNGLREATVVVSGEGLTQQVRVVQLGQSPEILVNSGIFTIEADGGRLEVEITANILYDLILPSDANWIKLKADDGKTRAGMISETYFYQVEWNMLEAERSTDIVIRSKDKTVEKKVKVIQKGQSGYAGGDTDGWEDDIKVPVQSGYASSFQSGGEIEKSFDGNMSTQYHSRWDNSSPNYFPITIEYNFKGEEPIDYLVYYPRMSGSNGLFRETEIWMKNAASAHYVKLMDYDFRGSAAPTRVELENPLENPTGIRFVINSGTGDNQGFASCAEMEFYRNNPGNFDLLSVFSDVSCSELKAGITIGEIEKIPVRLFRNIAIYLFNDNYPKEFRIREYKAWPHPDDWAKANKTSTYSLLDNPTGISVRQGEELIAFIAGTNGNPVSIKVQDLDMPGGDGYNNASYYPLKEGMNKLKMNNRGLVYVFYHTPGYAALQPVRIHFATGTVNGYFDSQKHLPSDWSRLLNATTDLHFDVVGKYAHLTFRTSDFKQYAPNNGTALIDAYDDLVRLEQDFMGLAKYGRPTVNRAYFHVMYANYMYATGYRTAYNATTASDILTLANLKKNPWGPAHELGHINQTRPGFRWLGMSEVSNNVHSLYVQTQWGNPSRIEAENMARYNNRYEKAFHNSFVENMPHPALDDVFCKLVPVWQLQLYFSNARGVTDFYKDLYERVRISPGQPSAGEQQLDFVKMVCDVAQHDLTGFFGRWGFLSPYDAEIDDYGVKRFSLSQQQIDAAVADIKARNYPPASEMIEYICDANWELFKNRLDIQPGSATKNGTGIEMRGWKNVAAYEVYEGDELVFVSNKSVFALDSPVTAATKVYAVAYDGQKTEVAF